MESLTSADRKQILDTQVTMTWIHRFSFLLRFLLSAESLMRVKIDAMTFICCHEWALMKNLDHRLA